MTNTFIVIALSMLTLSAPLVAHAEWVLGTVVLVPNDAPQPPVLEFSTGGEASADGTAGKLHVSVKGKVTGVSMTRMDYFSAIWQHRAQQRFVWQNYGPPSPNMTVEVEGSVTGSFVFPFNVLDRTMTTENLVGASSGVGNAGGIFLNDSTLSPGDEVDLTKTSYDKTQSFTLFVITNNDLDNDNDIHSCGYSIDVYATASGWLQSYDQNTLDLVLSAKSSAKATCKRIVTP